VPVIGVVFESRDEKDPSFGPAGEEFVVDIAPIDDHNGAFGKIQALSHYHFMDSSFGQMSDPDYASDPGEIEMLKSLHVTERNELHLAVSMRSFRAEVLSAFVGHVVEKRAAEACRVYQEISDRSQSG